MFEGFSFDPPSRQGNSAQPVDNNNNNNNDDDLRIQCDSNLVSPLSSRCPSPGLLPPSSSSRRPSLFRNSKRHSRSQFPNQHLGPAPTSMPPSYIEQQQQQQQQHRLSIGSLTHRLHVHSIENGAGAGAGAGSSRNNSIAGAIDAENNGRGCPVTPRSSLAVSDDDLDMSTADTPTITTTYHHGMDPLTPPDTDLDDDMTCFGGPSPTSSPGPPPSRSPSLSHPRSLGDSSTSASAETTRMPDIRSQRETLSILQSTTSTVGETIRLAALLNDSDRFSFDDAHHPSSLPPTRSSSRRRTQQQHNYRSLPPSSAPSAPSSSSQTSSRLGPTSRKSRIDKSHYTNTSSNDSGSSGNNASLFSGEGLGLRRRSLVLAAVSAVLENEAAQQPQSSNGLLSPRSSPDAQAQPQPSRRRSYASPKSRLDRRR